MLITQTFRNETLGKVVDVVTDETGTYAEHGEVWNDRDKEMGRPGHPMDVPHLNRLFAYWQSAGHKVRPA